MEWCRTGARRPQVPSPREQEGGQLGKAEWRFSGLQLELACSEQKQQDA